MPTVLTCVLAALDTELLKDCLHCATACAVVVSMVLQILQRKAVTRAEATAVKVEKEAKQVKQVVTEASAKLQNKLEAIETQGQEIKSQGAETHTLVNGNMAAQLKLNAETARRLADLTKLPADEVAAATAEALYQTNLEKQKLLDSKRAG